jgi:hypothetical protein
LLSDLSVEEAAVVHDALLPSGMLNDPVRLLSLSDPDDFLDHHG